MATTTLMSPFDRDPRLFTLWHDSVGWLTANIDRIVIAGALAALVATGLFGLKWFGRRLVRRADDNHHGRQVMGAALAKIRLWFIVAVTLQIIASYAHAPDDIAQTVHFLFVVAATLQAAVFARETIIGLIERRAADHEMLGSAMNVIRVLITVALFSVAIILILSNLGVNVTGLVAGLGIGGIAIGLAAQGIFADLFAALAILLDRPFRKGDAIRFETTAGEIEDIGLKSTRIRALTGEEIIVANKQLLEKEIHNFARLDRRRITTRLQIVYHTPAAVLARIPAMIGEVIAACPPAEIVRAGLVEFGASSLDFDVQYDVRTADYDELFATRHAVNIAILTRFAAEGIEFAYPTQTTFTAAPDGHYVMPYAVPLNPASV